MAAAARDVLVAVIGRLQELPQCRADGIARVEADYDAALQDIPDGRAKTRGIKVGQEAAAAILVLRESDGSDQPLQDFMYPQGTKPGEYRFTPGLDFAFARDWGKVRPFVLKRGSQFRARPPYDVRSKKYAADFK